MLIVKTKKAFPGFEINAVWRSGREVTVLFGPSGSGKTTLLRMIAGLEQPDEGYISAADRVLFDGTVNLKPEARKIGFVFQNYALFPWLTVRKNIRFGLPRSRRQSSTAWLDTLTTTLGIGSLLDQRPARLSGGEAQRVALARALAPHPELLLMDEPFSAVGGALRIQLRNFIRGIQKEWGIPVVLVTHDLTEAHLIGDHLIRLDAGRVSYDGPIDGLVQNRPNELMAAY